MKCSLNCPYWYFRLTLPARTGVICKKHRLPLSDAREKCFVVTGQGRARKRVIKPPKPVRAERWPGSSRGYGSITKEMI
jgi:hypothetical protein